MKQDTKQTKKARDEACKNFSGKKLRDAEEVQNFLQDVVDAAINLAREDNKRIEVRHTNAAVRMAVKYSLDAAGVRDKKTRAFIAGRVNKIVERRWQRREMGGTGAVLNDLRLRGSLEEIIECIGVRNSRTFSRVFLKKINKIEKIFLTNN